MHSCIRYFCFSRENKRKFIETPHLSKITQTKQIPHSLQVTHSIQQIIKPPPTHDESCPKKQQITGNPEIHRQFASSLRCFTVSFAKILFSIWTRCAFFFKHLDTK